MLEFGGWQDLKRDEENELTYVRWSADEDLPYISERLMTFNFPKVEISEYEKTLKGLDKFDQALCDLLYKEGNQCAFEKTPLSELRAKYRLGCLIYFQLHMTPTLSVTFEG